MNPRNLLRVLGAAAAPPSFIPREAEAALAFGRAARHAVGLMIYP